ncbi:linear amide C-N hydrolase [Shewanella sp. YLB-09]|nr:linear amide C-N hydrolase [Shewanella sp. YLB-09]
MKYTTYDSGTLMTRGIPMKTHSTALACMITLGLASASSFNVEACTDVAWNTKEFGTLISRTNDWLEPTKGEIRVLPAGSERLLLGLDKAGGSYKTKYTIAGVFSYGGLVHDVVNSEGMRASVLYYGPMAMGERVEGSISQLTYGEYLATNFASVKEVIANIEQIKSTLVELPGLPIAPKFHWTVTDKSGDRAIIELDPEGVNVYTGDDAKVMTNQPSVKAHIDNWDKVWAKQALQSSDGKSIIGEKGNVSPEQRYLHARYFLSHLTEPQSTINGLMKLQATVVKVPHDAPNRIVDGKMTEYATEWTISQSLETGTTFLEYTWGDVFTRFNVNFYDLIENGKPVSIKLDDPNLAGDITQAMIDLSNQ